jgi:hypothetical protein
MISNEERKVWWYQRIRSCKAKKGMQYNDQKKKGMQYNDQKKKGMQWFTKHYTEN